MAAILTWGDEFTLGALKQEYISIIKWIPQLLIPWLIQTAYILITLERYALILYQKDFGNINNLSVTKL